MSMSHKHTHMYWDKRVDLKGGGWVTDLYDAAKLENALEHAVALDHPQQ